MTDLKQPKNKQPGDKALAKILAGVAAIVAAGSGIYFLSTDNRSQTTATTSGSGSPSNISETQTGNNTNSPVTTGGSGTTIDSNTGAAVRDIKADTVTINIKSNDELPGYFPQEGFKAPPLQLEGIDTSGIRMQNRLILGEDNIVFQTGSVPVRGKVYDTVFSVSSYLNQPKKQIEFRLDGTEKGFLLQFGLSDTSYGDPQVEFQVEIWVGNQLVWAESCKYGSAKQIRSVPVGFGEKVKVSENDVLRIVYYVSQQTGAGSGAVNRLYFTKAILFSNQG